MSKDLKIDFRRGGLTSVEQTVVADGFDAHGDEQGAPEYRKERVSWIAVDGQAETMGVLTADILWDWIYVDELWVSQALRGQGLGRDLMRRMEAFARSEQLEGIWLWTQSWQAEGFYTALGYSPFTRFDNFPRGHSRIGFRKTLSRA